MNVNVTKSGLIVTVATLAVLLDAGRSMAGGDGTEQNASQIPFDSGIQIGPILESLRGTPSPSIEGRSIETAGPSDKNGPTSAGVKVRADNIRPNDYHTSSQGPRLLGPFGPHRFMNVEPGDGATLSFKSTDRCGGGIMTQEISYALIVSLAPAAEAFASCGSDQQMLKLNHPKGTVSPATLCLSRTFQEGAVIVDAGTTWSRKFSSCGTVPVTFTLTVKRR